MTTSPKSATSFTRVAYLAELMAELNRAEIKRRLQESRKVAGLTQKQMSDILHTHERTVQDYESLKKEVIPFEHLDKWADVTATTTTWLLQGDEVVTSEERLDRLETQVGRAVELLELMAESLARAQAGPERSETEQVGP